MRPLLILISLCLLPGCALTDGTLNLNATEEPSIPLANAIDATGLPMCKRDEEEDWSSISN